MADFWDRIDRIYCISLAQRTDRRKEAAAAFARAGVRGRVAFMVVPPHPGGGEQGCYTSHLLCMKEALAEGADRILIFEDDIRFDRLERDHLGRCAAFMDQHPSWHVLFLGCMVRWSRATAWPGVRRVGYRSLTHGYVIHRRLAERLVARPWQGVPYDDFLRDLEDPEMYAVYPAVAFQSNSRSDNRRYLPLDRFRRLCGGLARLQRLDEWYHRYRPLVIGAHALILLGLLWWGGMG